MKVSIITITYNSSATVHDTLVSAAAQSYPDIEHIVVDGASSDNTLDIVKQFPHVAKLVSEKDRGIYHAMNKGLSLATGDVIGILNSDDFFSAPDVIEQIVEAFTPEVKIVFGDIVFVSPTNTSKIIRRYSAKNWMPSKFRWGFMPPHPACYIRRECFDEAGGYQEDYRISSDYELLTRFLHKKKYPFRYLPLNVVTMRAGGVSTKNIKARYILNKEIVRACRENGIYTNMFLLTFKYFRKAFEYV